MLLEHVQGSATNLQLATVSDGHGRRNPSALRANLLNSVNHVHPFHDLAKHDVLTVKPFSLNGADEELRSISVGPSVGHGQNALFGVEEFEILVLELITVDRLAASSVAVGKVTSLQHEIGDDAMDCEIK